MPDNQTPPDWVLIEAAKRGKYPHEALGLSYRADPTYAVLCDMIAKYEQPPVDRKLLCAMEAWRPLSAALNHSAVLDAYAIRVIELWEKGFGQ